MLNYQCSKQLLCHSLGQDMKLAMKKPLISSGLIKLQRVDIHEHHQRHTHHLQSLLLTQLGFQGEAASNLR